MNVIQSMLLSVSVLKTNPFKGSRITVPLPQLEGNNVLCSTVAVVKKLRSTSAKGRDPLFSYRDDRDNLTHLSSDRFRLLLHTTQRSAGSPTVQCSVHSFRRGSATYAANQGISTDAFIAQAHWRSICSTQYISRDANLRVEFSAAMAASFHPTIEQPS